MHELLFGHQHALEDDDLNAYAAERAESARFERERFGDVALERVQRDVRTGEATGEVLGTPTLFIDGVVHRGSYDAATLLEALTA